MSILYIVATPIGNLADITMRAIDVLKNVDLILAEDTRVTKKLLDHYDIKTPTLSYHQHSKLKRVDYIIELLKGGKNLALVSDAGTPGISDPGSQLIHKVLENGSREIKIVPVPGASAVAAAASISGFSMDRFIFLGFPPTKKKRKKFFEEVINSKYPVIFYESPHRIIKTLTELNTLYLYYGGVKAYLEIVICRELTKKFETIYRGNIEKVIEEVENPPAGGEIKGEFVVIVETKK
ncbi:MAG: 16S rRNA (cytidine(1402)-2'-O)-methyltransferase [bacterium]